VQNLFNSKPPIAALCDRHQRYFLLADVESLNCLRKKLRWIVATARVGNEYRAARLPHDRSSSLPSAENKKKNIESNQDGILTSRINCRQLRQNRKQRFGELWKMPVVAKGHERIACERDLLVVGIKMPRGWSCETKRITATT
jgi:hypothetical protein